MIFWKNAKFCSKRKIKVTFLHDIFRSSFSHSHSIDIFHIDNTYYQFYFESFLPCRPCSVGVAQLFSQSALIGHWQCYTFLLYQNTKRKNHSITYRKQYLVMSQPSGQSCRLKIWRSRVRFLLWHKAYLIFPAQKDEHHQGAHPQPRDSALICLAALGLLVKVRGNNFNVKH